MKDYGFYKRAQLNDPGFPVVGNIATVHRAGPVIESHWHEQIEILYIKSGEAVVECNMVPLRVFSGDVVLINSNELHSITSVSVPLEYYCIVFDTSLLQSCIFGVCEKNYIMPLEMNMVLFDNRVSGDAEITRCLESMTEEFKRKLAGHELAIKSLLYMLVVLLFRNHRAEALTEREFMLRNRHCEALNKVIVYIQENYAEKIKVSDLAALVHMSVSSLSHLYKKATGMTIVEHINRVRISGALHLIQTTDMDMTEIAMTVGITDSNYFSKLFKKYQNTAPSKLRLQL